MAPSSSPKPGYPSPSQRYLPHLLAGACLLLLAVLTVWAGYLSLSCRLYRDGAAMFMMASLMDRFGWVPYRDFFDLNMPGSFAVYAVLGHLTDYHAAPLQALNLVLLALIGANTWFIMRGASKIAGCFAALLFAARYLTQPYLYYQREFFLLLFLSSALAILFTRKEPARPGTSLVTGVLVGMCAIIKPQWAMLILFLAAYQALSGAEKLPPRDYLRRFARWVAWSALGMALPAACAVYYLWSQHALASFLQITRGFFPVYALYTGPHAWGMPRFAYLASYFVQLGEHRNKLWVALAALGAYRMLRDPHLDRAARHRVLVLCGLLIFFAIYPVFSGQFFINHYMPLTWVAFMLAGFLLEWRAERSVMSRRVYAVAGVGLALVAISQCFRDLRVMRGSVIASRIEDSLETEIAAYINPRLGPADRVQTLQGFSGLYSVPIMLRTPPATSIVYDHILYVMPSRPYVQELRRRFVREITASDPRFIVEMQNEPLKSMQEDPEYDPSLPEFRRMLASRYRVAVKRTIPPVEGDTGYVIWERSPNGGGDQSTGNPSDHPADKAGARGRGGERVRH